MLELHDVLFPEDFLRVYASTGGTVVLALSTLWGPAAVRLTGKQLLDLSRECIQRAAEMGKAKVPQEILGEYVLSSRALEALKGSITKWERIAAEEEPSLGSRNCPLCREFKEGLLAAEQCRGCPVMLSTGKPACRDTPYDYFPGASGPDGYATSGRAKEVARREVAFLRSLLPREEN
jgi:hypothetical protein